MNDFKNSEVKLTTARRFHISFMVFTALLFNQEILIWFAELKKFCGILKVAHSDKTGAICVLCTHTKHAQF